MNFAGRIGQQLTLRRHLIQAQHLVRPTRHLARMRMVSVGRRGESSSIFPDIAPLDKIRESLNEDMRSAPNFEKQEPYYGGVVGGDETHNITA